MFAKRKSFNPKRRIADQRSQEELARLAEEVRYGGNPEHKCNPGDFGLAPPARPRRDKTLCDGAGILSRAAALQLLQEGIRRGLVSRQGGDYPQNIWAISADGLPLEAQLENPGNGTYHGYPMPAADPFRAAVLEKWSAFRE